MKGTYRLAVKWKSKLCNDVFTVCTELHNFMTKLFYSGKKNNTSLQIIACVTIEYNVLMPLEIFNICITYSIFDIQDDCVLRYSIRDPF